MARIAGDNPGYTFSLCRWAGDELDPEKKLLKPVPGQNFDLRSVTTIIENVIPKPFGAGVWHGYRMGLDAVAEHLDAVTQAGADAGAIEALLKDEFRIAPNIRLDEASDRGQSAHDCLELCILDKVDEALDLAAEEFGTQGTKYGYAVIDWVGHNMDTTWESEQVVWSLQHQYAGTTDLIGHHEEGLEIADLKTHKPNRGFTKRGPAYLSDLVQVRAYRTAIEEMRGVPTIGNRVIVARENGEWLEDRREVPERLWFNVLEIDRMRQEGEWT